MLDFTCIKFDNRDNNGSGFIPFENLSNLKGELKIMKKLIALALVLIMMISGNAIADTLASTVNVNGTTFTAGTQGTLQQGLYTYSQAVSVNGITYAAGTQFQVMQLATGQMVPVATATGAALPIASGFSFAAVGAAGLGIPAGVFVAGAAVVGVAALGGGGGGNVTTTP